MAVKRRRIHRKAARILDQKNSWFLRERKLQFSAMRIPNALVLGLGQIQYPAILDPLFEAATSFDDQIAYHALAALYRLPEPGLVGPLSSEQQHLVIRAMQHTNREVSALAACLTGRFQFAPAPLLQDFAQNPHKYGRAVRLIAVENFALVGTNLCARTNLLPHLRQLLHDPDEKVRHAASVAVTLFEGCMQ